MPVTSAVGVDIRRSIRSGRSASAGNDSPAPGEAGAPYDTVDDSEPGLPASVTRETAFFSIVSANYLAYAITLMQSVRRHHPDAARYVFLADEDPGTLDLDPTLFHGELQ